MRNRAVRGRVRLQIPATTTRGEFIGVYKIVILDDYEYFEIFNIDFILDII